MFLLVFSRCRRGGDTDKSVVDRKSVSFRRGGGIVGRIGWKSGRCRNGSDVGAAEGGGEGGGGADRSACKRFPAPVRGVRGARTYRWRDRGALRGAIPFSCPFSAYDAPSPLLSRASLSPFTISRSRGASPLPHRDLFAVHVRVHTSFSRSFPFDRLFLPSPPPSPQQQRNKEESKDG